jgi:hypothetical protein
MVGNAYIISTGFRSIKIRKKGQQQRPANSDICRKVLEEELSWMIWLFNRSCVCEKS